MPTATSRRLLLGQIVIRKSKIVNAAKTAALTAVVFAAAGCQTYTAQTQSRDESVRSGDLASAAAQADRDAEKNKDNKDTILYRLEQGAILRSAALANIPVPVTSAPAAPALTAGQTQTNQALVDAPAEVISPRIAYLTRSLAAFDEAAARIDRYEEEAKIRVGAESGALLTNQANLPYRGRAYDKVMLHTYKALNYLQLRDADAARVELNRALQRQRDAVEANAKRIEEAQRLAAQAGSGGVKDEKGRQGQSVDVDRAKNDPRTSAGLAAVESKFNAAILPYGDYVNPFTTFLDALVYTHLAEDGSDLERARKSWERVVNFAPQNPHARADYIAIEPDLQTPATPQPTSQSTVDAPSAPDASAPVITIAADTAAPPSAAPSEASAKQSDTAAPAAPVTETAIATADTPAVSADTVVPPADLAPVPAPATPPALTYVIFETGAAPYRDQIRIDLPLFLVTRGISYVGMALPELSRVGGHAPGLQIATTEGQTASTALVASMDSVVAQDFKNEWPSILTKTIISTATKATIDAIIQKQIEDQGGAALGLLTRVATAAIQASVNIADTRTWRSLPKEFQYARLATPADLQLTLSSSGQTRTITLEPAAVQVVYVKSTSSTAPLLVGQFVLKK